MIRQHLSGELMTERTVFITGGGSGINLGIAKTFAAVGASSQCGNRGNAGRTLSSAATLIRGEWDCDEPRESPRFQWMEIMYP
jgi:NAD(P)-dependent dehydrogenase (short-subunit alcohol dehydrogenase family)